jgi:hypothetical protein
MEMFDIGGVLHGSFAGSTWIAVKLMEPTGSRPWDLALAIEIFSLHIITQQFL